MKELTQKENRRLFINKYVDINNPTILEIGALNTPTFNKNEKNIYFGDYLSQSQLKKKYTHKKKNICEVDILLETDRPYCDITELKFDLIIANHVIEHVPDIIYWLRDLASITTTEGKVFLAVPDKRFTFDYIKQNTSLSEIIEYHVNRQKIPTFKMIFEHLYNYSDINCKDIWQKKDISKILNKKRYTFKEALDKAILMSGKFQSLHCHVFTLDSFLEIFNILSENKLIPWCISKYQDVCFNGNEFHILFKKQT